MVNVLGCLDDQCTKYATLTTSAEKLIRHGKGVCPPIISRLNKQGFNDPGVRWVHKKVIKIVYIKLSSPHMLQISMSLYYWEQNDSLYYSMGLWW
jgi:hypothetical protein